MAKPRNSTLDDRPFPKLAWLFSHAFLRDPKRLREIAIALSPDVQILIDSGAFTNFTIERHSVKRKPITLAAYMQACRTDYSTMWQCVALDVVKDSKQSLRNLRTMREAGLNPMAVLQEGADYDQVPELIDGNPYLCVAGGVYTGTSAFVRYQRAFKASAGKAKIHALGFLRWPEVLQLPLYSGDSSSNVRGQRFGTIMRFNPVLGIVSVHWFEASKLKGTPRERELWDFLRACKCTPEMIGSHDYYHGNDSIPSLTSMWAFLRLHQFTTARGFRSFSVYVSDSHIVNTLAVLDCQTGDTFDYPRAVELSRDLRATLQRNTAAGIDRFRDILQRQTRTREDVDQKVRQYV